MELATTSIVIIDFMILINILTDTTINVLSRFSFEKIKFQNNF